MILPLELEGEALSADAIIQKMLATDHAQLERRAVLYYTLETTREKLDGSGKPVSSKTETQRMRGSEKIDYGTRNDAKNGMEEDLEKASKEEPFELFKIISHYTFALDGEEEVLGQYCYRIRYTPKPEMPFSNREEKVLNHVSGTLWIKKDDFTLMRNEGALNEPVSVAWFFATLGRMWFRYEAAPLPNGDFGPAKVQYQFKVNVLFHEIRERHTRVMKEYSTKP